jgi:DNA-binding transcriptional MerR regulator
MDQKSPEAFRTISEVADWLGVPTHVLRFWESRFAQVKPVKRAGGRRYYRPTDMELLGGIRKLLHEDGMTIRGVQKLLREQGVKHVAALSPALDLSADTKDVTPDNVVDLSGRRGSREATDEAGTAEDADQEGEEPRFPFDDDTQSAPDEAPAAAPESADEAQSEPESFDPGESDAAADAAAEMDSNVEPDAPADSDPDIAAVEMADAPDITDPLPDPEEMEFLSHDAAPETFEDSAAEADDAPADDAPTTEPVETDPADPMSSPDALEFAAHDAEPELAEDTEATGDTAEEAAPTALVMPEIGPDPEDEAAEIDEPVAMRLRALRAARADMPAATLRAFADRLDELKRHGASDPGDHRGM